MGKLLTAYQMREVAKVLDVERRQREFIGQAAGSDPSVVLWPWAAPPLGRRHDLTPDSGDHAPNTMDNFCFEITLSYRRLERPRRAGGGS